MKKNTLWTAFFLILSFNATAQGEVWDEVYKKTYYPSSWTLNQVFDERYIHAKNISTIRIDAGDSSYLHKDLNTLYTVETVVIENIEEQPLAKVFEALIKLPNLKNLIFTQPIFSRGSGKNRSIQIPASITQLKNIETIKFFDCRQLDINDALQKLKNLVNLAFLLADNCALTEVPTSLCSLGMLEGVSLFNNNITELPECFNQLENLRYFNLTFNNSLRSQPFFNTLSLIPNFEYLQLNGELDSSFSGIGKLKKLKRLQLKDCNVNNPILLFKDLAKLKDLRQLNINSSYIPIIPSSIGRLKTIYTLSLKYLFTDRKRTERLTSLPHETGNLRSLISLDASSNEISYLPNSFSKLKRLSSINLQGNLIDSFPSSLTKAETLKTIDLSYNKVVFIPEQISNLKKLELLQLTSNQLTILPKSFGLLSSLKELDLQRNKMEVLPFSFTRLSKLEKLYLQDNKLEELPMEISGLRNLSVLNVENNRIAVLPRGLRELTNLETLNISNNHISNIQSDFRKLKKLKHFSAGNNNLTTLPDSLGSGLQMGSFSVFNNTGKFTMNYITRKYDSSKLVSQNRLQHLPVQIPNNTLLSSINISNNPTLDSIETIQWIQSIKSPLAIVTATNTNISYLPTDGWKNFKGVELNLANNQIKHLPPGILSMPNIKNFSIANNPLPKEISTSFTSKAELNLAMAEAGIIPSFKLTDDLLEAALKRARFYYYKNDFKNTYRWHQQIEEANSTWANNNILNRERGEAKYFNNDYNGAIKYLSIALERDTAHNVRIVNSIRPSMYYIGQSYLKLKDTSTAYNYMKRLADRFLHEETSMLSEAIILANKFKDTAYAENFLTKALAGYRTEKPSAGVQLSILELFIIADKPFEALKYAESIDRKSYTVPENFLWEYLKLSASISAGKATRNDLNSFISNHDSADLKMPSWSFSLYEFWLATNRLTQQTSLDLKKLHSFATQKLAGSTRKDYVVPFF